MTIGMLVLAASIQAAQGAAAPATPRPAAPATYEEYVAAVWKGVHDKILDMARDLPEDKLSWKPHPDSRTMAEEFRHVTIGLEMSTAELTGAAFDYGARLKADGSKPASRASIVRDMEAAIAASYVAVRQTPRPRLVWWIDHQAEHYGKLVSNYRVMGLVPPVSRKR